ncbi:hypothetical protein X801_09435 [Opisthorchis viverrini]|uniref:THO complex subunit 2 N-terminal domain-containing protein n=1 Tax=Opisthorchis viverrini TaxID=6198 RepID=A0A1S8WJZ7_OPIVI|nr:hypothetical protein X801_09435 [Opisthorchis viverrini]
MPPSISLFNDIIVQCLIKCKEAGTTHSLRLLLDLFVKLIGGEGKVDILTKLVPELMRQHRDDPGFESKFLDVLWLLGTVLLTSDCYFLDSTVTDVQSEPVRDRYFRLLHLCKTHVNPTLLMERLSEETLENMSLIQSKQQFQTRYVRTKTRLFFKQQKFNLLREENEGYAKLITELAQASGSMDAVMTQIRSLIGYFDLDPNRVLDLILDVCEFREPMTYDLMKLIRLYNPDKTDLTHILGHKFHFTQFTVFSWEDSGKTTTHRAKVGNVLRNEVQWCCSRRCDRVFHHHQNHSHGQQYTGNGSWCLAAVIQIFGLTEYDLGHEIYVPWMTDFLLITQFAHPNLQEPGDTTPQSLYKVAALLISDGLVNLDILYGHLPHLGVDSLSHDGSWTSGDHKVHKVHKVRQNMWQAKLPSLSFLLDLLTKARVVRPPTLLVVAMALTNSSLVIVLLSRFGYSAQHVRRPFAIGLCMKVD